MSDNGLGLLCWCRKGRSRRSVWGWVRWQGGCRTLRRQGLHRGSGSRWWNRRGHRTHRIGAAGKIAGRLCGMKSVIAEICINSVKWMADNTLPLFCYTFIFVDTRALICVVSMFQHCTGSRLRDACMGDQRWDMGKRDQGWILCHRHEKGEKEGV